MVVPDHKTAELGFGFQQFFRRIVFFAEIPSFAVRGIKGQAQMPRVIEVMAGQSVVADLEIWRGRLAGEEDFHTVVQSVLMSEFRENQKIRLIADRDLEMFAEQIVEKVIGLVEAGKNVTKVEANWFSTDSHRQHGRISVMIEKSRQSRASRLFTNKSPWPFQLYCRRRTNSIWPARNIKQQYFS